MTFGGARPFLALAVGAMILSACTGARIDPAAYGLKAPVEMQALENFRVSKINVVVPESLTISEADGYVPRADIVWRGEPYGDRYKQVEAIVDAAMKDGTRGFKGAKPISLDVEVVQFHALTERSRATVGGVHALQFMLTVRDAGTGAVLVPTHLVDGSFDAYGGAEAMLSDRNGRGEKVRIQERLAEVIRAQLTGTAPRPIP